MFAEEDELDYFTEEIDLGAESDSEPEEPASPMTDSTMSVAGESSRHFWVEGGPGSRRTRSLRSGSFSENRPIREFVDRDCAIWLVIPVLYRYALDLTLIIASKNANKPCRTLCCGGLFCLEHISNVCVT